MSDMFGHQFYPTPKSVGYKMVDGLKLGGMSVLDPGAGRGDLLQLVADLTNNSRQWRHTKLYAIEIDPELRVLLTDKGFKVIDTDFLAYSGQRYFDLILMNPSFDRGVDHLLKAWEVSNGALIKCLLNANTVQGYEQAPLNSGNANKKGRLHQLLRNFGSVKYLGQPFKDAERPTNVEVALITLQDTRPQESFRLDFDPVLAGKQEFDLEEIVPTEIASADIFENYEARHKAALATFKKLLEARQEVRHYLDPLLKEGAFKTGASMIIEALKDTPDPTMAYDAFYEAVTASAWDTLFSQTKISNVTTEKVRKEIEKLQASQGHMAFTAANMYDLFYLLQINKEQIMLGCVKEVFQFLTSYYPGNPDGIEAWMTNSSYRVDKFIIPWMGNNWGSGLDYSRARKIDDLERALCFVAGISFEEIEPISRMYDHKSHYKTQVVSTFFLTQLYQKGTLHFWWRDLDLRDKFNQLAAKELGYQVPAKTKQGRYR